jgi:hypothetical protein
MSIVSGEDLLGLLTLFKNEWGNGRKEIDEGLNCFENTHTFVNR